MEKMFEKCFEICSEKAKSFIFGVALLILFCFSILPSLATEYYLETQIKSQIAHELSQKGFDSFEISLSNVPIFSNAENFNVKVMPSSSGFVQSGEYRTVKLLNKKSNAVCKMFGVCVKIKAYKNVFVANKLIAKGAFLSSSNCSLKKINITNMQNNQLEARDFSSNLIANKVFRKDEVIDRRFVSKREDVVKNDSVVVEFLNKNGMKITVDAISLSNGNVGDFVSCKNKIYNKVYTGKVVGKNRVVVEI